MCLRHPVCASPARSAPQLCLLPSPAQAALPRRANSAHFAPCWQRIKGVLGNTGVGHPLPALAFKSPAREDPRTAARSPTRIPRSASSAAVHRAQAGSVTEFRPVCGLSGAALCRLSRGQVLPASESPDAGPLAARGGELRAIAPDRGRWVDERVEDPRGLLAIFCELYCFQFVGNGECDLRTLFPNFCFLSFKEKPGCTFVSVCMRVFLCVFLGM